MNHSVCMYALYRLVYSLGLRVKPLPGERGRVRVRDICKQALSQMAKSCPRVADLLWCPLCSGPVLSSQPCQHAPTDPMAGQGAQGACGREPLGLHGPAGPVSGEQVGCVRTHTHRWCHLVLPMMCHCSLLCSVDMESSAFAQHLQPFLHGRTDHFVHEFVSFAKSPYDMIAYDEKSSYDFVPMNTSQDHPGNTHVHIQAHAQTYAHKNTHTHHTHRL